MKYSDLSRHLQPYKIYARRKTTINHAFAAAIAPFDEFDDERIRKAIRCLRQDPDSELCCVYCDDLAQTWDHVFGTVKNSRFSGHGHRIGNLVPTCKSCNSSKGNKDWKVYLSSFCKTNGLSEEVHRERENRISEYLATNAYADSEPEHSAEYERLLEIKDTILKLIQEADSLAEQIRKR